MTSAPAGPRLIHHLRTFVTPGPRMRDELECVASVMLAIVLAQALGARMIGWAAFSAFVLIRGDVGHTLLRGVLRVAGTLAGAGLALLVVPLVEPSVPLQMAAAGIVGGLGLYGAITLPRSYAWLLFGLTFLMVLLDKIASPGVDLIEFAKTRTLEVGAGTLACLAVSLASTLTLRRRWPVASPPREASQPWHPHAARHAVQAGMAVALLPLLYYLLRVPELPQAGVTIMAVMIVPASVLDAGGLKPVSRRLVLRGLGCLAGGALSLGVLLIAEGSPTLLLAGTCLGIAVGRHIENGFPRVTYLGLQFTLAVLVALVPDDWSRATIEPALGRLLSILLGMAVLEPILVAWHLAAPLRNGTASGVHSGETSSE